MVTTRDRIVGGKRADGRAYTTVAERSPRIRMITPGLNFTVKIGSADEMAEALLMILTYPAPIAGDGRKEAPPK